MKVLLDTHALLWIVADSPRLSPAARQTAGDAAEYPFRLMGEDVIFCV
jgi:PIN domain nuclease of toxin-antitoxin system